MGFPEARKQIAAPNTDRPHPRWHADRLFVVRPRRSHSSSSSAFASALVWDIS
jgi:hypothetical protein